MNLRRVHIIGTGLLGTSIGLALRNLDIEVRLSDRDPGRLHLASEMGAGKAWREEDALPQADLLVLCVPPGRVAAELKRAQQLELALTYSDVASIKAQPQLEAEKLGVDVTEFVGGHPIAGRERSGPGNARADLFVGRPWVLTPTERTGTQAVAAATWLATSCGAHVVQLSPEEHDAALGLLSHLPQALATLLASRLLDAPSGWLEMVGQGFRDVTRIADSDPELWAEIAGGNIDNLVPELRRLSADLADLAEQLAAESTAVTEGPRGRTSNAFRQAVARGNQGRERLPGKHGARPQLYVSVPVVVADEPGELARLLTEVGDAAINVEDLSLEHSPGARLGLCELLVRPDDVERLQVVLRERGWSVHVSP
jgi:prephenate dehydrogenase